MKIAYATLILAALGLLPATSSGQSVTAPRLSGIATSPNPPINNEPFTFTIAGSGFERSSAIARFSGPGCLTPCGTKTLTGASGELSGAIALTPGTFTVVVTNSVEGAESNSVSLTVSSAASPTPQLSAITVAPNPPNGGQPFTFKLSGNSFDPGITIVDFSGPGCETPCRVGGLTGSAQQLEGAAVLSSGTYTVKASNGASGTPSNSVSLTVSEVVSDTPHLAGVTTLPNPPVKGQPFTFRIDGSGLNPSMTVDFSGPGCETPCVVTSLTGSSKQLEGATGLGSGAFTVTVRKGPAATASNGLALSVRSETARSAQLTTITTSPRPPVHNLPFTFAVNGSGLNPGSAIIEFSGPGCDSPCSVTGLAVSSTELNGATLLSSGSFTVKVRNGANGAASNGIQLTVR